VGVLNTQFIDKVGAIEFRCGEPERDGKSPISPGIWRMPGLRSKDRAMTKLTQSYVHGASTVRLIGETLGAYFDRAVARWRDELALVVRHQQVRWSYGELGQRVDDFAAGLLALGLEPGDRVGIWSPNNAEWVITQFATAKAGLVLVNINPAYRLTEVEYALNKVGCKALITADHFKTSDYVGMLRELAPELDRSVPGHLSAARLPLLAAVIRIGADERPGMFRFADIMAAGGERHAGRLGELATRLQFDDPINIQFTSGTTGAPKGATLTHHHAIGSQSQYRSITASAWCWAISPASPMARRWSIQVRASSPWPSSRPSKPSAVRRCTACRRCSLPSSATPNSSAST
jgi:non-ribosomal peptide synthetase component F